MALAEILMNTANTVRDMPNAKRQAIKENIELESLQDQLEAQRGLRQLFSQTAGMPSYGQVGEYNPELAMKMQQLGLENRAREAQIRQAEASTAKTGMEMDQAQQEYVAKVFGPISEEALKGNIDQEEFKKRIGQAASELKQKGFNLPTNFDPQQHTPDQIMINSLGRGYKSPWMENQLSVDRERAMRGLPPQMSSTQAYGEIRPNPVTGQPEMIPPVPTRRPMPMGQATAPASMESQYEVAQSPEDMQNFAQRIPMAGTTDVASEKARIAKEEAKARKTGEMEAGEYKAAEEKANTLSSIERENVTDLIDKSISSKTERLAKGAETGAAALGQSTQAFEASEKLKVIGAQLRAMSKDIIGAGPMSDKDQDLLREAAANISADIPAAARKESYKTFMRLAKERLQKYPELAQKLGSPKSVASSQEEILDKAKRGEISREEALRMFDQLEGR